MVANFVVLIGSVVVGYLIGDLIISLGSAIRHIIKSRRHRIVDDFDFSSVDFVSVNFSGANLSGANLSGANLSGANLSGTDHDIDSHDEENNRD